MVDVHLFVDGYFAAQKKEKKKGSTSLNIISEQIALASRRRPNFFRPKSKHPSGPKPNPNPPVDPATKPYPTPVSSPLLAQATSAATSCGRRRRAEQLPASPSPGRRPPLPQVAGLALGRHRPRLSSRPPLSQVTVLFHVTVLASGRRRPRPTALLQQHPTTSSAATHHKAAESIGLEVGDQ